MLFKKGRSPYLTVKCPSSHILSFNISLDNRLEKNFLKMQNYLKFLLKVLFGIFVLKFLGVKALTTKGLLLLEKKRKLLERL